VSSSELSGKPASPASKIREQPSGERTSTPSLQRAARAELVWEGKYDVNGRRVPPLRVVLPFQTVETINESTQDRQRGFQFGSGFREEEWRNRLIWGDKKYVLPSLLSEFAGKINLIYIDPPFDTGADFSFTATVPDDPNTEEEDSVTFTKEPSIIETQSVPRYMGPRFRLLSAIGSMRRQSCCTNFYTRTEVSTFIWIGTSASIAKQFSMRCSVRSGL
jgi:hypothetical protein